MSTVTDQEACDFVASNIQRILAEQSKTTYWLMKALSMSPGAIYPIIHGESLPSIGTTARIAEALHTTVDELLKRPQNGAKKMISKKSKKSA